MEYTPRPRHPSQVAESLGGYAVLDRSVANTADLDAIVRAGLPWASLAAVLDRVTESADQREQIASLIAPRTTRLRREREGRFSVEESERLERIARIATLASQVLEDQAAARTFLHRPHSLLGGVSPISLLGTELGARRVEDLLLGIEYSLPV